MTIANGTVIKDVDEGETVSGVTGISGTNVTNFAMSGADGADNGLSLTGGIGTINIFGTITSTGGHSINIQNRTGGNVNLDGAVSDTGTGVNLASNGTTAVAFTGGLNVTVTGSSTAFSDIQDATPTAPQGSVNHRLGEHAQQSDRCCAPREWRRHRSCGPGLPVDQRRHQLGGRVYRADRMTLAPAAP